MDVAIEGVGLVASVAAAVSIAVVFWLFRYLHSAVAKRMAYQ